MTDFQEEMVKTAKSIFNNELIRNNIFNDGKIKSNLNDPKKKVIVGDNIFKLSIGYFYALYRQWVDDNDEWSYDLGNIFDHYKNLPNSTLRVLHIMDELYVKYSLNKDIIYYIMVNSQINLTNRTARDSSLDDILSMPTSLAIIDGNDDAFVSAIASEFYQIEKSSRYNPNVTDESFCNFLEHFDFFEKIDIEVSEDGNVIFVVNSRRSTMKVDSQHVVICRDGILYILQDLQSSPESVNALDVRYIPINNDEAPIKFTLTSEKSPFSRNGNMLSSSEFFIEVSGYDIPKQYSPELFYRGLNTGSYKYINRLAMSIVDSIYGTEEGLRTVYNLIRNHGDDLNLSELDPDINRAIEHGRVGGNYIAERRKDGDILVEGVSWRNSKRWDDIIARLLIIESPREILATFIEKCDIFDELLGQMDFRFNHKIDIEKIKADEVGEMEVAQRELILLNFGDMGGTEEEISRWVRKTRAIISSKLIVRALSELTFRPNATDSKKEAVGGSIYPRVLLLEEIKRNAATNNYQDPSYLVERSEFIMRQSLKTSLCTFNALLSCFGPWSDYEIESYNTMLSSSKIKEHQERIEKAFIIKLTNESRRYEGWGSEDLLKEMYNISRTYFNDDNAAPSSEGLHYYMMTGKQSLIQTRELMKVLAFDDNGNAYISDQDEPISLKEAREKGVANTTSGRRIAKSYINTAIAITSILGGCYGEIDSFNDLTQKSAFPFVGTYIDDRRNMDGHSICNFNIRNSSGDSNKVHILSEFIYDLNRKYYIVPNLQRTDREWWIQPFMIECDAFNKALSIDKESKNMIEMVPDDKFSSDGQRPEPEFD